MASLQPPWTDSQGEPQSLSSHACFRQSVIPGKKILAIQIYTIYMRPNWFQYWWRIEQLNRIWKWEFGGEVLSKWYLRSRQKTQCLQLWQKESLVTPASANGFHSCGAPAARGKGPVSKWSSWKTIAFAVCWFVSATANRGLLYTTVHTINASWRNLRNLVLLSPYLRRVFCKRDLQDCSFEVLSLFKKGVDHDTGIDGVVHSMFCKIAVLQWP